MSSLQAALDNAANKFNLKKLGGDNEKKKGGSGAFESCFAAGLDLSELVGGSSSGNRTSAAEELLKIKEEERKQRQIQEEEEEKMQEALQKRLNSLKNAPNPKERKSSGFDLGDALFRMHGSDEKSASVLSRKVIGGTSNRRRNSASRRTSAKSNKSMVAKKSRKSKF